MINCNVMPTVISKEQSIECQRCKYASKKIRWCGKHGGYIPGSMEKKVQLIKGRPVKYPTTAEMAKTFTRSLGQHIGSGLKKRSKEEQEQCLKICNGCDRFIAKTKVGPRCMECGCCINLKTRWATAHCPLNKW